VGRMQRGRKNVWASTRAQSIPLVVRLATLGNVERTTTHISRICSARRGHWRLTIRQKELTHILSERHPALRLGGLENRVDTRVTAVQRRWEEPSRLQINDDVSARPGAADEHMARIGFVSDIQEVFNVTVD
jgi:hypothetical protein